MLSNVKIKTYCCINQASVYKQAPIINITPQSVIVLSVNIIQLQ